MTAIVLALGLVWVPGTASAAARAATRQAASAAADPDSPPLTYWGSARQMITVVADSSASTTATLTAWERTDAGWRSVFGPMRAMVGAAGIGQASEGSTRTPAGAFSLGQAFGRQPNPGTAMPYFQTDVYDWWNGNSNSPQYNTHVRQAADPGASENLYRIGAVYDYAVDMGYNRARTPGAGSAFFLHVTDGRPTGGCVAIDRAALVGILRWLDPAKAPVINVGTVDPASRNPIGYQDSATLSGDTARVAGWAVDPDRLRVPVNVHVYDFRPDGSAKGVAVPADQVRPDLPGAIPGVSSNHGYVAAIRLDGPGRHRVCSFAINVDNGTGNPVLGCVFLDVPPPIGHLDSARPSPGAIVAGGWAADPVAPGQPLQLLATVSGPGGVTQFGGSTGAARPDVAAAIRWAGGAAGFSMTVPAQGEGTHQVCVSARANHLPAALTALGCTVVSVRNAFGYLDSVTGRTGTLTVGGWAVNPNNPGERVQIHIYDYGPSGLHGTPGVIANQSRPDVAAVIRGYDANHGYLATVPAERGQHRVCTYAITTGGGYGNPQLGCKDVAVG